MLTCALAVVLALFAVDLTEEQERNVTRGSKAIWEAWYSTDDAGRAQILEIWAEASIPPDAPDPDPDPDPGVPADGEFRKSVSSYAITWMFRDEELCGRYANGDWWVHPGDDGVVVVTLIDPASSRVSGRWKNGSMINPSPGFVQGFDSSAKDGAAYNHELNVGSRLPLTLRSNQTLVSTKSFGAPASRPQITDASVLTVVSEVPPDGSFRPAYCGSDKSSPGKLADIDWSKLPSARFPGGRVPQVTIGGNDTPKVRVDADRAVQRVWLDFVRDWSGRVVHPSNNMPVYGAEIEDTGGAAALVACAGTAQQRVDISIGLIQIGIDLFGIIEAGAHRMHWNTGGAHGSGRLGPMLFAGLLLDSEKMLKVRSAYPLHNFNELAQVFEVGPSDAAYPASMRGVYEWGNQHNRPEGRWQDDPRWAVPPSDPKFEHLRYRTSDTQRARWGWCAALEILGLRQFVAHKPFFEYPFRYHEIQVRGAPNALPQTHATIPETLAFWESINL